MVGNEKGMSLVEIMVALMLLTVGIMGYLSSAAKTTQLLGNADHSTTAASHAQGVLDSLRMSGCATAVTSRTTIDTYYDLGWTATYSPDAGQKAILLTVTYPTTATTARTDTLESLIAC